MVFIRHWHFLSKRRSALFLLSPAALYAMATALSYGKPKWEVGAMKRFDAIVIGSGQGGVPLAAKLAELGWKVALIEKGQLGGSCINYGCTPTKAMIASSRIAQYGRVAPQFGVHVGKVDVNMSEVI